MLTVEELELAIQAFEHDNELAEMADENPAVIDPLIYFLAETLFGGFDPAKSQAENYEAYLKYLYEQMTGVPYGS